MTKSAGSKKSVFSTAIQTLGVAKIPTPLHYCRYIDAEEELELNLTEEEADLMGEARGPMRFEKAGPPRSPC